MAAGTARRDTGPANDPVDGVPAQASPAVGLLRLTGPERNASRTYLRVGGDVFPVYGDAVRGWSPRADDFRGVASGSPWVYRSLDELFFALVNLCTVPHGEGQ